MAVDSISGNTTTPYIQQQLAGQAREAIQQATQNPETVQTISPSAVFAADKVSDQVQLKHTTTSKNLDTVRAIEMLHARLNEQAKGVRETNEALANVSAMTEQMKTTAQSVIKNFPPFPVEDSHRQEILMSYVSIKKEIERLTVPAPPPAIYDQVRKMWSSLFSENGQMLPSAVPSLEKNSSQAQVKNAAAVLDRTGEQLSNLSNDMTQALIGGR